MYHIVIGEDSTLDFRINVQDVYSLVRLFSNLYAVIWVYTFINFEKKVPTCTFIPVYTIILLTLKDAGGGVESTLRSGDRLPFLKG